MYPKKVSDEVILAAYKDLGSVWKVGDKVGLCGQTVHERLTKLGAIKNVNRFTDEEDQRLRQEYAIYRDAGKLQELADSMGREKTTLCGHARKLGLTDPRCPKLFQRVWKDMPENIAGALLEKFKRSPLGLKRFCAKYNYGELGFARTMKAFFPAEYEAIIELKAPRQSYYRLGRALEYRVRDLFREQGFYVLRSPQSKGPADLLALRKGLVILIQCKRGGSLAPAEWNELYDLAESLAATAVVASLPELRGTVFKRLVGHKIPHKRRPPWQDYSIPPQEDYLTCRPS